MKKIPKHFSLLTFSVMPLCLLFVFAWQNPDNKSYSNSGGVDTNQKDTVPKDYNDENNFEMHGFDKAMKQLDINMAHLDEQMKNLNVNLDKQIEASLSKIDFDAIEKQTEASLKQIDWSKMQNEVDNSLKQAQKEIAKVDFTKMQNDMKVMQEKLKSQEFKTQFNSEKMHKQIDDAMSRAKESIEKAKVQLQRMKDFTNALAADSLIDKKKSYTIEWKNGSLFINGKEQPKSVSDKYRKYESEGEIKMEPDNAEHF